MQRMWTKALNMEKCRSDMNQTVSKKTLDTKSVVSTTM